MNAHRIGINDKRTFRITQSHKAILLLQPAEQQTQPDAYHGTYHGYHSSLKKEDMRYLLIVGTQISQRHHIVLLVDNQHRERTDDVEACHHQDKGQEDIRHQFLYLHNLERILLLLEPIKHLVFVACYLLHLSLHRLQVAALLQSDFQVGEHALLVKEVAGKRDGGDDVILVVFRLLHGEEHTRRYQRIGHEAVAWTHHVELSLLLRRINLQEAIPSCPDAQRLSQTDAHRAILQVGSTEREVSIAIKNIVDMR